MGYAVSGARWWLVTSLALSIATGCHANRDTGWVYPCAVPSDCLAGFTCVHSEQYGRMVCALGGTDARADSEPEVETTSCTCAGRSCGDDGCGGSCGTCPTTDIVCREYACVDGQCTLASIPDGAVCSNIPCGTCRLGACTGVVQSPICGGAADCEPIASLASSGLFGAQAVGPKIRTVTALGEHALIGAAAAGLRVLTVDPVTGASAEIAHLQQVTATDISVAPDGRRAAAVGDGSLWILDLEDPAAPVAGDPTPIPGAQHVVFPDGAILVTIASGAEPATLRALSVDEQGPIAAQAHDLAGAAGPLDVRELTAFVACGDAGLCAIELATGTGIGVLLPPDALGPQMTTVVDVAVSGEAVWVLDSSGRVAASALTGAGLPSGESLVNTDVLSGVASAAADRLGLAGTRLLITTSAPPGLVLMDTAEPTAAPTSFALPPGSGMDEVAVLGPFALVAAWDQGLHVVHYGCE